MKDYKAILATVLIFFVVLFGIQYFYKPKTGANAKQEQNLEIDKSANLMSRPAAITITKSERVIIKAPKMSGSILLKGLKFDDLILTEFTRSISDDRKLVLLAPYNTKKAYFASFGWIAANGQTIKLPDTETVWKANNHELSPQKPVVLSWDNGQGLLFNVRIEVDDEYLISITNIVLNSSANTYHLMPYGLISKTKRYKNIESAAILHEGPLGVFNDILSETSYEKIEKEKKQDFKESKNGWIGMTDKYWLTTISPDNRYSFDASYTFKNSKDGFGKYQVDYVGHPISVSKGEKLNYIQHLFVGPKNLNLLEKYSKMFNIENFDLAIDFGWLYFITKPIFIILQVLHNFTGNFGISIMLLTVIIKLLMLPLANKSYVSISKMKALSPIVNRLKEKYKDDKMRFNYEIMQLYKREKVNPLSGCVPIIIQIPVFFALYKVLYISIDMRQAPFFGWIQDLSVQDPTSMWNLFGLAPWDSPEFLAIGILPLLMGITMFIQQMLNPTPTDKLQAQMMRLMPVIFVFMFYKFPAGLVLYWAWNNILSIFQQMYINKKVKKDMYVF